MTTAYSTLLGLALPVTGELSGTWGDTVDNGITKYLDIAVAGTVTLTNDGAVTLSLTNGDSSATNIVSSLTGAGTTSAQFAIIRVTGTLTVAKVLTAPSSSRTYVVVNAATGSTVTVKASGQTGVSIAVGETAFVYFNGTDYVKVSGTASVTSFTAGTTGFTPSTATTGAVTLAGTLATTNGGTNLTSFTSGGAVYATSTSVLATGTLPNTAGGTGQSSAFTQYGITYASTTTALATTAAGTSTTVLHGNASGVPTFGAVSLTADVTGTLPTANGGTNLTSFTANGVVYASSTSALATGSALTFDGTSSLTLNASAATVNLGITTNYGVVTASGTNPAAIYFNGATRTSFGSFLQYFATNHVFFNETGGSEIMRLVNTGNVGIGTSSPAYQLTVGTAGTTANSYIQIASTTTGTGNLFFGDTAGTGAGSYRGYIQYDHNVDALILASAGSEQMRLDSSGNLGLGVTPSAWYAPASWRALQVGSFGVFSNLTTNDSRLMSNAYLNSGGSYIYTNSTSATNYIQQSGSHQWFNAASGTAGNAITFTQAMTLDASGNLLVGTTTAQGRITSDSTAIGAGNQAVWAKSSGGSSGTYIAWNAVTTGNPIFVDFYTETAATQRGTISYNRAGGLVVYNTTSDYRAKDIYGPVTNSGTLIDTTPVYMGKMKGATQERPMFIAHEVPAYAHTGEKDAVDADGNPVYQQMDTSALVPVLWAEIQSLRKRLADAGI